ncbi:unnamed protein product [Protopolystoma xenopodis]|uniref:Uncharacterized protein n=1 Tax=Protopolystoma xenopodis TaxID=117903 RepID=A0A448WBF5_9PLAT|nr:unnamed protein product [Protopolystoma xenopodis]
MPYRHEKHENVPLDKQSPLGLLPNFRRPWNCSSRIAYDDKIFNSADKCCSHGHKAEGTTGLNSSDSTQARNSLATSLKTRENYAKSLGFRGDSLKNYIKRWAVRRSIRAKSKYEGSRSHNREDSGHDNLSLEDQVQILENLMSYVCKWFVRTKERVDQAEHVPSRATMFVMRQQLRHLETLLVTGLKKYEWSLARPEFLGQEKEMLLRHESTLFPYDASEQSPLLEDLSISYCPGDLSTFEPPGVTMRNVNRRFEETTQYDSEEQVNDEADEKATETKFSTSRSTTTCHAVDQAPTMTAFVSLQPVGTGAGQAFKCVDTATLEPIGCRVVEGAPVPLVNQMGQSEEPVGDRQDDMRNVALKEANSPYAQRHSDTEVGLPFDHKYMGRSDDDGQTAAARTGRCVNEEENKHSKDGVACTHDNTASNDATGEPMDGKSIQPSVANGLKRMKCVSEKRADWQLNRLTEEGEKFIRVLCRCKEEFLEYANLRGALHECQQTRSKLLREGVDVASENGEPPGSLLTVADTSPAVCSDAISNFLVRHNNVMSSTVVSPRAERPLVSTSLSPGNLGTGRDPKMVAQTPPAPRPESPQSGRSSSTASLSIPLAVEPGPGSGATSLSGSLTNSIGSGGAEVNEHFRAVPVRALVEPGPRFTKSSGTGLAQARIMLKRPNGNPASQELLRRRHFDEVELRKGGLEGEAKTQQRSQPNV